MDKILLVILLEIIAMNCIAQTNALSGQVVDEKNKENLPYVTVLVATKDGSRVITGTVTDKAGRFSVSGLQKGEYSIDFSYLGYEKKSVELLIGELNSSYNLGKIMLTESTAVLDEVQVVGQRALVSQNLDKKSFDINNNISQSGGSILDAMSNLPGVSIDREGKVLLRGSDRVAVLIDGKQSALTGFGNQKGLDNIPASHIERIEIINNPSAKYDASGMAGVINIIYKKETQTGFNGDAGLTFGMGQLSKRKKDYPSSIGSYHRNPKIIPSLNLNHKSSKVNVFLQAELMRQRNLPNNEFTTRNYADGRTILSQIPENRMQTHYLTKGGIDLLIDERNTLTVSGIYDYENHLDKADVCFFNQSMEPGRVWQWDENESTGFAGATGTYKHKFINPGHEITASLQYTRGWENEKYRLRETSTVRTGADTTHVIATEHVTQLTVDYIRPMPHGRIEAGVKGQIRRLPVTYNVYKGENSIIYPGLGDWSDWGEDVSALYIDWILEKSRIDVELGLRTEYTRVFYDISQDNIYYPSNDDYGYLKLYPNIRLTWKINSSNRLSAFYNHRIDRPGEAELRIFPKYDDPELLKVGNPYLRPQYTHNFELAYKFLWNAVSLFLSGYHKIISDPYSRIYVTDERSTNYSIINKVYENTGKTQNTGTEVIVEQKISKDWKISGSFNFFRNYISAYGGVLYFPYERPFTITKSDDNTWYAKLNSLYSVGKNSQIQLSGVYFAPMNIPQGKRSERGGIDMGYKKSFCSDKIELTVSIMDVFNTMGIKETVSNESFEAIYENYYETQVINISMKVKF
jgi:outer membrane receptor protein involved in Fe transport